jgi:hypothetical protein
VPPVSRRGLRSLEGERRARSEAHPDAIIPDLSKPDPLVTFGVADIAFV